MMKFGSRTLLVAGAGLLAACSDSAVMSAPSQAGTQANAIEGNGATANLTSTDTIRFTVSINSERASFVYLGAGNWVTFPAHSVCDPTTSTYGPTEWDKPCTPARNTVAVKAKAWLDSQGHPRVDFDQHLRFVPSLDPAQWVMLSFTDYGASAGANAKILYCATPTSGCVDEAKTDPTMATVKDPVTGHLTRRIKHFSGYNVFSGQPCMPSPDNPDCVDGGGDMLGNRVGTVGHVGMLPAGATALTPAELTAVRTGYMLAWA
ncbi:MAG TPA: hypothetical protein VN706_24180 [Gemmatimonadaceae bacterium]|nr:hypothetical protein [Gemmatimonadaceae bacterium]